MSISSIIEYAGGNGHGAVSTHFSPWNTCLVGGAHFPDLAIEAFVGILRIALLPRKVWDVTGPRFMTSMAQAGKLFLWVKIQFIGLPLPVGTDTVTHAVQKLLV